MIYNPSQYWIENGKSNIEYNTDKHKIQEQKLLEYLKTLEFKSVLEIGCGYGRIADLIINNFNIDKYMGIDISNEQIDKIKTKYPAIKFKFLNLDITEVIPEIQHPYARFDLVIAVDTLMHIKPNHVYDVIATMTTLSRKHVINMDYYVDTDKKEVLEPHNFKHEYKDHYERLGLGHSINIIPVKEIEQCIFHVVIND